MLSRLATRLRRAHRVPLICLAVLAGGAGAAANSAIAFASSPSPLVHARPSQVARSLGECQKDQAYSGIEGSLPPSKERVLGLYDINLSTWSSGGNGYYERRYDSAWNVTYFNENDFGGYDSYGTSGNASRMTSMQPTTTTLTTWDETEEAIC